MSRTVWLFSLAWLVGCSGNAMNIDPTHANEQNAVEIKMVLVPAGTFLMGGPSVDSNGSQPSTPQHEVTLTTPFFLGVYEVTNEQYFRVMGPDARFEPKGEDNLPVTMVTRERALKFCEKLSELPASVAEGKVFRLPTEAEWEYACRAGSTTAYCFGDSPVQLDDYAWFSDNRLDRKGTYEGKPVGLKKPNAWGLYDMHGNMAELCQDILGEYPKGPITDPQGPKDGYSRVLRGGAWGSSAENCRSTSRANGGGTSNSTGFRVAMNLTSQLKPVKAVQKVPLAEFDQSNQLDHQSRGGPLLPMRNPDYAAMKESFWQVTSLLANGADPNAKSEMGTPILFHAIDDAEREVKMLISNWDLEDDYRRSQKLPAFQRSEPIPKRLESLLQAGADPNLCDQNGQSPLHYAIANCYTAIKYLHQYGADPNKPDSSGRGLVSIGANHLTAFIDVQQKLLFYVVAAWEDDFTGYVIDYGCYPDQQRPYFTLREARQTLSSEATGTGLEGSIYAGLESLTSKLLDREWQRDDGAAMRISRCLIDANWGQSTDVVYQFCRQSKHAAVIIPSHGRFVGASSLPFSEYRRRPGDRVGLNWRIPNVHGKRAIRHVVYDTNWWKSFINARLRVSMGDRGCLSLFGTNAETHRMFSEQLTSEYFIKTEARGRSVNEWKQRPEQPDNHWFDCLIGSAVAASMQGALLFGTDLPSTVKPARTSFKNLQRSKKS